jgi:hypothetical protein
MKKGISSIIAILLIILIGIIAVVIVTTSQTELLGNVFKKNQEMTSDISRDLKADAITNGVLYASLDTQQATITKVKVGDNYCNNATIFSKGRNNYSLSSCLPGKIGYYEVTLFSEKGTYSKTMYVDSFSIVCSLDGISRYETQSYNFYNTSSVPFGSTCYSLTRTCQSNELFSGSSTFQYKSCSVGAQDITPSPFSFASKTKVALNVITTSEILTPSGYDGPLSVSVGGSGSPQISINGGAWTTSTTMMPGQTLQVRMTSSASYSTLQTATITLGSYSTSWNVTTTNPILARLAIKIAGTGTEYVRSVALDSSQNIYVTGSYTSANLNFGNGFTYSSAGSSDIFVAKYNSSGTPIWVKSVGGTAAEEGYGIDVDSTGNVYVTGYFVSASINFGNSVTAVNSGGSTADMFIVKYNSSGIAQWAKYSGKISRDDYGRAIVVDASNNLYVAGEFQSDTLVLYNGKTVVNANEGNTDGFVVKYDSTATTQWAKGMSCFGSEDKANSLAVDSSGNVIVGGIFNGVSSGVLSLGDSISITHASDLTADGFIVKYNSAGTTQWAKLISSTSSGDYVTSVGFDSTGNVYSGGYFRGSLISFGSGISVTNDNYGNSNSFLVKYNSAGTPSIAINSSGLQGEELNGLAIDTSNNVYGTGTFDSTTMYFNPFSASTSGTSSSFLVKLDSSLIPLFLKNTTGTNIKQASAVAVEGDYIYSVGQFTSPTIYFGNSQTLTNVGNYDGFIVKYGP